MNDEHKDRVSKETQVSYETNKRIRRDWGNVRPFTRIEQDKRKKKPKYKNKDFEEQDGI